jgi:hypothetical protein
MTVRRVPLSIDMARRTGMVRLSYACHDSTPRTTIN